MNLYSEQYRHECEVRDVIRRYYPDAAQVKAYLDLVMEKRGAEAHKRLRNNVLEAWKRVDQR